MASKIVFTTEALDDLRRLGPSVARRVIKKIYLLEDHPEAGPPLGANLVGFRKLVVGNRDWRVIYRIVDDDTVEICEVWAIGARSDDAIYREANQRLAKAARHKPDLLPFAEGIAALGRLTRGFEADRSRAEKEADVEPVPSWLAEKVVQVAGVSAAEVAALSAPEAFDRWNDYITQPR